MKYVMERAPGEILNPTEYSISIFGEIKLSGAVGAGELFVLYSIGEDEVPFRYDWYLTAVTAAGEALLWTDHEGRLFTEREQTLLKNNLPAWR